VELAKEELYAPLFSLDHFVAMDNTGKSRARHTT